MPNHDDRSDDESLRGRLLRAAEPADPTGAYERILERRVRRRIYRRVGVVALATLVVGASAGGAYALFVAFRTDTPAGRPTPTSGVTNGAIAFASDAGAGSTGASVIYVVDPSGSGAHALTDPMKLNADDPAWSPDGSMIAFDAGGSSARDIFVMNADGSVVRMLTQSDGIYYSPAWSPDQTTIYFVGDPEIGSQSAMFAIDVATGSTRWVARSGACPTAHPAVAPNGSRIAIRSVCPDGTGAIYLVNPDGTDEVTVPGTEWADSGPSWSPDGSTIVFSAKSRLETIAPDGTRLRALVAQGAYAPSYSPDGTKIVFQATWQGELDLWVMGADGGDQIPLVGITPTGDHSPSWQPVPPGGIPSPSPNPTPTGSPLPSGSPPNPQCPTTSVEADFDGDGVPDRATVGATTCFGGATPGSGYSIQVAWASGAAGSWSLPECTNTCEAYAAADLNGSGIAQLAIIVDAGASTQYLEVYELPPSEIGPAALTVAPPGTDGFAPDQPARFPIGGSVTHLSFLTCRVEGGLFQAISTTATLSLDQTTWNLTAVVFHSDIGYPPSKEAFYLVSVDTSTQPFDPSGSPPTVPGDPCFVPAA